MGTMAAKAWLWKASRRGSSFGLGSLSTLLRARIVRPAKRLAFSTSASSLWGAGRVASTTSSSTSIPSRAAATSRIIWRFSTVRPSCRPGVSISTTWAFSRVTMPWMRLRVVCGLEATMATFWPTRRFSSVDFPALGRPTTAAKPARWAGGRCCCAVSFMAAGTGSAGVDGGARELLHFDAQHLALVGFQHLEAEPFQVEALAWRRHLAPHMAQQAGDGGHGLVRALAEVHAQHLLHVVDGSAAAHHQRGSPVAHQLQAV